MNTPSGAEKKSESSKSAVKKTELSKSGTSDVKKTKSSKGGGAANKKTKTSKISRLFKKFHDILEKYFKDKGTIELIPNPVRSTIKTEIKNFIRKNGDSFIYLNKIGNLEYDVIYKLALSTKSTESTEDNDFKDLIQQLVKQEDKIKFEKDKPLLPHEYMRQLMDKFLAHVADWREMSLSDLSLVLESDEDKKIKKDKKKKKKKKAEDDEEEPEKETMPFSEDDIILLSDVLHRIQMSPPLEIPRDLVDTFLETADFIRNTDGDPAVFCRKYGLVQLTRVLDKNAGLPDADILKKIQPLISQMGEKDRRLYKLRFLNLSQIRDFIVEYVQNPFSIHDIIKSWIEIRAIKLLGADKKTILEPPTYVKKKFATSSKKITFIDFNATIERPLLYMILRPWIPKLRDFVIRGHPPYYDSPAFIDDDSVEWYYPNQAFYIASCKPDNHQKGTQYIIEGKPIELKYRTLDGKEFLQTEAVYKREQKYFETSPQYDIPFLEKACKNIRIAFLDYQYTHILRNMGRDLVSYSLTKRLSSKQFKISAMSASIVDHIFVSSTYIEDFFTYIFAVVSRLDVSVSPVASLQVTHQKRLADFMYKLESLHLLTDSVAFPEKTHYMTDAQRTTIDEVVASAASVFVRNQVFTFRMKIYPFQRIHTTKPLAISHKPVNITLPENIEDVYYSYGLVDYPDVLDLQIVAAAYVGDDLETPVIHQTKIFFDLDRVYYRDFSIGIFWSYPEYYTPADLTTQSVPSDDKHTDEPENQFVDFWTTFEKFLTHQESLTPKKSPETLSEDEESMEEVIQGDGEDDEKKEDDEDVDEAEFDPNNFEPEQFLGEDDDD